MRPGSDFNQLLQLLPGALLFSIGPNEHRIDLGDRVEEAGKIIFALGEANREFASRNLAPPFLAVYRGAGDQVKWLVARRPLAASFTPLHSTSEAGKPGKILLGGLNPALGGIGKIEAILRAFGITRTNNPCWAISKSGHPLVEIEVPDVNRLLGLNQLVLGTRVESVQIPASQLTTMREPIFPQRKIIADPRPPKLKPYRHCPSSPHELKTLKEIGARVWGPPPGPQAHPHPPAPGRPPSSPLDAPMELGGDPESGQANQQADESYREEGGNPNHGSGTEAKQERHSAEGEWEQVGSKKGKRHQRKAGSTTPIRQAGQTLPTPSPPRIPTPC